MLGELFRRNLETVINGLLPLFMLCLVALAVTALSGANRCDERLEPISGALALR
jgi:hypothetical protein